MEHHRNGARIQQGGKRNGCVYGDICARLPVCVAANFVQRAPRCVLSQSHQRLTRKAKALVVHEDVLLAAIAKESEVKILCYCTPE